MRRYLSGLLFLCIFFTACDQEPLFWDIVHEYPPIRPVINGSPSGVVSITYPEQSNPVLYISNGTIWEYDTNTDPNTDLVWQKMSPQPAGGRIKALATTKGYLFSLDWNGNIKKWDGSLWTELQTGITGTIEGIPIPEQIFGAGDYLFAGALTDEEKSGKKDGYCILAIEVSKSKMEDPESKMSVIKENTGLLFGVVSDGSQYFIGTRGNGIYKTGNPTSQDSLNLVDISGSTGNNASELSVAGLIKHGNFIVAVTTRRQILYYDGSIFESFASPGVDFSGAMASWEDSNGNRLLLLGLLNKSGSFGYGYRELIWKNGGNFTDDKTLYVPGENDISSVEKGSQYTSAIGNYAVSALFVPPISVMNSNDNEERPVIYASTIRDGLWSYRKRNEKVQWNGENNSK